jgi:hypothetical protein
LVQLHHHLCSTPVRPSNQLEIHMTFTTTNAAINTATVRAARKAQLRWRVWHMRSVMEWGMGYGEAHAYCAERGWFGDARAV